MTESKDSIRSGGQDVSSEPRVPKGSGRESGQWTADERAEGHQRFVGRFKQLRQDLPDAGYYNWGTPIHGEATQRLIYLFLGTGRVEKIYFNDDKIKGAEPWPGHDNHFHVRLKLP
jgi:hypothetical protein